MKRAIRCLWGTLAVFCGVLLGTIGYFGQALPEQFTVTQGQTLSLGEWVDSSPLPENGKSMAVTALKAGSTYQARLRLLGLFPLKDVAVSVTEEPVVMVCGSPFGIKLYTDGVLVVGMSEVDTVAGSANPARAAGVCIGDTILAINGQAVTTNKEVSALINACEGKAVTLRLRRDDVEFNASFTPVRPEGETGYRAGLWVRDSTAGVGTLTFYDPETGTFGGLGHAVCDVDTGVEMSLSGGEIVPARIFGVEKSSAGEPGELNGCFEAGTLGELRYNGTQGLYGILTNPPKGYRLMPVARRQQVETGVAQVLVTLDGTEPQLYDIAIKQIKYGGASARHMVVEVTDSRLLALAGGIVQGMSGSPILQNGKLVGAVTHVLVDDPTKGYAIFAENMLETAQSVAKSNKLKDAS